MRVFILLLGGREADAFAFAERRYPASERVLLPKAEWREGNWRRQLRRLRQLRGEALVIFSDSVSGLREPILLQWTVLLHHCRETVLADASGALIVSRKSGVFLLTWRTLVPALADVTTFVLSWAGLQVFRLWLRFGSEPKEDATSAGVAFLYPSQSGLDTPGGALTHVTGFLSAAARLGARVTAFSGQMFQGACDVRHIAGSSRRSLLREAATLSYNLRFIVAVRRDLRTRGARLLYQRHGRFLFAGAVLSRLLKIPLVLEYNASEERMVKYWDPVRFRRWIRLCEAVSIAAAARIVVVSKPLRQELIDAGVRPERILVNPNGVDPQLFYPGCGGAEVRRDQGFAAGDIVVAFVGTFSYWHGVTVLEEAIRRLLNSSQPDTAALKFLLIGDGLLAPGMRTALAAEVDRGAVVFTGALPHPEVRAYLDAADILVSPHGPMPDGTPFFGSPTKLFEYMAMRKAIVASALDQIAEVLDDGVTALLAKPGDAADVAAAILRLASDPGLRAELGRNARQAVLERHTWQRNAETALGASLEQRQAHAEATCAGSPVFEQENS